MSDLVLLQITLLYFKAKFLGQGPHTFSPVQNGRMETSLETRGWVETLVIIVVLE